MALGLLCVTAPALSACGFTPMYAQPGVSSTLAATEIVTPQGRTGQLIAEALADQLGVDRRQTPAYRLVLALDEKRYARGLRVEETATWYELSLKADYSLIDIASGQSVAAGHIPVSISYDAARDPYAGVVAQQDGQKRAADEAAMRIRLELSRALATRRAP
ncbi:MAG: LPS assembly lipoprotein LptE [Caulobacteraceae bacterium]